MNHHESCVVVVAPFVAQALVEKRVKELVSGFRANLERMREQPKKPVVDCEDPE